MRKLVKLASVVATLAVLAAWTVQAAEPSAVPPTPAKSVFTCPMHPQVQMTAPGMCPLCKMNLVAKGTGGSTTSGAMPGMAMGCPHCMNGMAGMNMDAKTMSGMEAKAMPGMESCPTGSCPMNGMGNSAQPIAVPKAMPASYRGGGRRCGC